MGTIEWTMRPGTKSESWNPVFGCTKVSPGCANCYAERMARRQAAMGHENYGKVVTDGKWNGKVVCDEDVLLKPLSWRKPRTIFVNSMADLFHEEVLFTFIAKAWAVMALCPQHVFQVLTKRVERMAKIMGHAGFGNHVYRAVQGLLDNEDCLRGKRFDEAHKLAEWRTSGEPTFDKCRWNLPLSNVWLGTSVENNDYRSRIGDLIQCPAAVRFLSCEPLLGQLPDLILDSIDQLIIGGESGPGARPCDIEDIRSLVRQGKAAGVAVFVKQRGGYPDKRNDMSKWPEDLRVREFPVTNERRR